MYINKKKIVNTLRQRKRSSIESRYKTKDTKQYTKDTKINYNQGTKLKIKNNKGEVKNPEKNIKETWNDKLKK